MKKIRILDSNTINQIAAGEVLERPASCVKELVENAIDAGAKRIEVYIREGGKKLIKVADDGIGMDNEDASLAICRHATSKLRNVEELTEITTLGFRGEALPTITSVSKFQMYTRQADKDEGIAVEVEGGIKKNQYETGCPIGTTIIVKDLFYNTPARQKFMKSEKTESAKIHDYMIKLALSRPEITFKLTNNGKEVFFAISNNLEGVIKNLYGATAAESLLKVDYEESDGIKISGYVSKPNVVKSYRSWQTIIVNGRIIASRQVYRAIDDAYSAMIPKGSYPLTVLVMEIPAKEVDVNVHPQKTEVRFADDSRIYRAVYRAVKQAVEERTFTGEPIADGLQEIAISPDYFKHEFKMPTANKQPKMNQPSLNFERITRQPNELSSKRYTYDETLELMNKQAAAIDSEFEAKKIEPLGQIDKCYIIGSDERDMYIIDQHAAHERILFDRLNSYVDKIPAQQLLMQQKLKFDAKESQIIESNREIFAQLGFTLEYGIEGDYWLTEVPVDAADVDAESLMREIMSSLRTTNKATDIAQRIRHACIAMTACKAAIKAGQPLNTEQMSRILEQLSQTTQPYTCPHGRPTILKFSSQDLAKMFKRTGF